MPTAIGSKSSPSSNSRDAQHVYVMVSRKCWKKKWINREAEVLRSKPQPAPAGTQAYIGPAYSILMKHIGQRLPSRWTQKDALNGRVYSLLYWNRKRSKLMQPNEMRRFKLTW